MKSLPWPPKGLLVIRRKIITHFTNVFLNFIFKIFFLDLREERGEKRGWETGRKGERVREREGNTDEKGTGIGCLLHNYWASILKPGNDPDWGIELQPPWPGLT